MYRALLLLLKFDCIAACDIYTNAEETFKAMSARETLFRDAAEYMYTTSPRNFTAAQISKLRPINAQSNATFCVACERSTAFTMSVIGEKKR